MLVAGFKEYLKNRRFMQYFFKLQKQMIRQEDEDAFYTGQTIGCLRVTEQKV